MPSHALRLGKHPGKQPTQCLTRMELERPTTPIRDVSQHQQPLHHYYSSMAIGCFPSSSSIIGSYAGATETAAEASMILSLLEAAEEAGFLGFLGRQQAAETTPFC